MVSLITRAAIYARVSTDDQTVDPQLLELRAYASSHGFSIVKEYTDVISGAKAQRPGLDSLVAAAGTGSFSVVLAVKLDRLGRSVLNVVTLVQRLKEVGVSIICTSQGIDNREENPCGKMVMGIMASFAEFERDLIRERTKAGLRNARAKGQILGKPCPGLVGIDRVAVVREWVSVGRPGGLRGLGIRLGGCSSTTARKVFAVVARQTGLTLDGALSRPEIIPQ